MIGYDLEDQKKTQMVEKLDHYFVSTWPITQENYQQIIDGAKKLVMDSDLDVRLKLFFVQKIVQFTKETLERNEATIVNEVSIEEE